MLNISDSDDSTSTISDLIDSIFMLNQDFREIVPRIVVQDREKIPKSNFWQAIYPNLQPRAFKKIYRMSRETVDNLAIDLYSLLEVEATILEDKKYGYEEFKKAVCVALNYLTIHERQYDLGIKYNCSVGYVNMYIRHVTKLLTDQLLNQVVYWPDEIERPALSDCINSKYKLPMCLGCLDGTYIYCKGYGDTPADYTCRKFDFAFNVVLFNDQRLLIRYFISNNVGAKSDDQIVSESEFMHTAYDRFKFGLMDRNIDNPINLSTYYIIADKGLRNSNYIMTPYSEAGRNLSKQQKMFNYWLTRFRSTAEITIGLFK